LKIHRSSFFACYDNPKTLTSRVSCNVLIDYLLKYREFLSQKKEKHMIKKFTSLMLIGLVLNLAFYSTAKAGNAEREAKSALKVKNEISKLGTGKETSVKVKLRDGRKVAGYISELGAENFTVIDTQTGSSVEIRYSQVKKAKGINHLTGKQILYGILYAWMILAFIAFVTSDEF
jgi:hypothetical protein